MIVPYIDVAQYAHEAGFRGEPHAIVVALAQPESGRNPDAVNSSDPNGGSFGLLQINGAHDPDATGTYPNLVPSAAWIARMKDPTENLKAAYQVWLLAGKSFKPWGAFTSGLHLPSLSAARVALDGSARVRVLKERVEARETRIAGLANLYQSALLQIDVLQDKIANAQAALA